eukprot:m.85851 g.85851  ORF g.85851 m.85851 type:complete len:289 (+) comp36483_c0_seq3:770-1636(+)
MVKSRTRLSAKVVDELGKKLKKHLQNLLAELKLSPGDGSGLNSHIMNFLWKDETKQQALKQAIGDSFEVHWERAIQEMVIRPKESKKALFRNWVAKCKNKFKAHQAKFFCKHLGPVDGSLWDRLIAAAERDEKRLSGEVAIYENSENFLLVIVGNHSNVSVAYQSFSSTLSGWKKKMEEDEAVSVASVKAQTAGILTAVVKSSQFSALCKNRPQVLLRPNNSELTIDIETKRKYLSIVRKEVEDVVKSFECYHVDLSPPLAQYFSNKATKALCQPILNCVKSCLMLLL